MSAFFVSLNTTTKMATFSTEIRKHQRRADGTYNIKLRITHHRRSRWIPTSITISDADLTSRGKIRSQGVKDRCEDLLRRVRSAAAGLSPFALDAMDVDALAEWIRKRMQGQTWRLDFFAWGRACIEQMSEGARGNYRTALNALARYLGRDELDINALTAAQVRAFGDWLDAEPKQQGRGHGKRGSRATDKPKVQGGVSAAYVRYLSRLHALARRRYNNPDDEQQLIPRNPFEDYGSRPTAARGGQSSLGVEGIQALIDARPDKWEHREGLALFLLSFCFMGVNIADLFEAEPLRGEWWVYRRKKVRNKKGAAAEIRVRVPQCAMRYLWELRDGTGARMLNLHLYGGDAVRATQRENKRLRSWQKASGWQGGDFTFYACRHSWATIAHNVAGADLAAVDEALGHNGNLKMAAIYVEKDWEMLNRINERVLALFDWGED